MLKSEREVELGHDTDLNQLKKELLPTKDSLLEEELNGEEESE